jgi:hypothetical protein
LMKDPSHWKRVFARSIYNLASTLKTTSSIAKGMAGHMKYCYGTCMKRNRHYWAGQTCIPSPRDAFQIKKNKNFVSRTFHNPSVHQSKTPWIRYFGTSVPHSTIVILPPCIFLLEFWGDRISLLYERSNHWRLQAQQWSNIPSLVMF